MKVERVYKINKVLSTINEYSKVENIPYKHQVLYVNIQTYEPCSLNKKEKRNNIVIKPIRNKNVLTNFSNNTKFFLYDENLQLYDISCMQSTLDVYC